MAAVIRVENLGKRYRLGLTHAGSVRELVNGTVGRLLGRRHPPAAPHPGPAAAPGREDGDGGFWALRDLSFEVAAGEVVGIIGRNGSGKSTLLKILSEITAPTRGRVQLLGRVASLLEVGTGFHPELTGRENVFLNGAILGMTKAEVRRKFDEIVAFAEIEQFIDTPVKRYSSGMYVRLAFAVAAHLEPEILLVDEVLAVGDIAFQAKCLGRMHDVASEGRTVLFVSHNLNAVATLTKRAVLLDGGRLVAHGPTRSVIKQYLALGGPLQAEWSKQGPQQSGSDLEFTGVRCRDRSGTVAPRFPAAEPFVLEFDFRVRRELEAQIAFRLNSSADVSTVFTSALSDQANLKVTRFRPGEYRTQCRVPAHLLTPGKYHLLVAANNPRGPSYDILPSVLEFEVSPVGSLTAIEGRLGTVAPLLSWELGPVPVPAPRVPAESPGGRRP